MNEKLISLTKGKNRYVNETNSIPTSGEDQINSLEQYLHDEIRLPDIGSQSK
jgi:hypothetical protein